MSLIPISVERRLQCLRATFTKESAAERLSPHREPVAWRPPRQRAASQESLKRFWVAAADIAGIQPQGMKSLADDDTIDGAAAYAGNIENMIGTVKVPVGVAGPLRVNGLHASGDYLIPLATTEAALVASYSRGAEIITAAGGATAAQTAEGVLRAPGFAFADLLESGSFVEWVASTCAIVAIRWRTLLDEWRAPRVALLSSAVPMISYLIQAL